MLTVDRQKCSGCGWCQKACPFGAIWLAGKTVEIGDSCTLCGACVNGCPEQALSIERKKASPEKLAAYAGVLVWGECARSAGRLTPKKVVYELVGRGRVLADRLNEPLSVACLGDRRPDRLEDLIASGADRVVVCRHRLLDRYATDSFTSVLAAVIAGERPSVFLCGATANGRELAPRIAARLDLGLTADCTGLSIDDQRQLVQTRPAFGGNVMASIVSPYTRPQMATVRPNVFAPLKKDPGRRGRIVETPVTLSRASIRTKVVEEIRTGSCGGTAIEDASVIVAAGRGCGRRKNLDLVRQLAEALGGVMAGSRAIVELGWIPHTLQVGQSGTTVAPRLYVAVGISGAVQHLVGMRSSDTIVAINADPAAPIFKIADFGIVGDALDILPPLIRLVRQRRGRTADLKFPGAR